ncbi:MAG TPA: NRDE family protein [Acidimicrobiales bacterium]|nr:NRDE family protein [Acidimicrobiales bacterium]
MCLLVVVFQVVEGAPLIVAANRDERYDREAIPMTTLSSGNPRILGGRDELAGGTWLAVNEHGVVAGLTNKPATAGRDPAKRSRGEIPLVLASEASAADAVATLRATLSPASFNPCWVLVGDRDSLHYVDMTETEGASAESLSPGIYVLENKPLRQPSAKVEHVRNLVGDLDRRPVAEVLARLRAVLANHVIPQPPVDDTDAAQLSSQISACCVHTTIYGTRSSMVVCDPATRDLEPEVWASNGPSCVNVLHKASFAG